MATVPFSIRLDSKLKSRLEKEAKRRDRTAGFLANRAIKLYFEQLDSLNKEFDDAEAEADKGVFISEEAVNAWMKSWGTGRELPPPEPDIFPESKAKKKVA
jgi:predicted transcriptional regulator